MDPTIATDQAEPTTEVRHARPGWRVAGIEWLDGRLPPCPEPAAARARIFARVVAHPRCVRPRARGRARRTRRTATRAGPGDDGDGGPPSSQRTHAASAGVRS